MTTSDPPGLAATKLCPPLLPERHIARPALLAGLQAAAAAPQVKVLLVSAPAGAGKTTLLASLAGSAGVAAAWLHLDGADDDPARFWHAVAAAVERARPGAGADLTHLARTTRGDPETVVPALVNALAPGPPLLLVLDDYHGIEDPDVHDGVDLLVERLPPTVTLAIGTRTDPPLRLGRLRVRGQLHEVRNADLRFDVTSARALLDVDGLDADDVGRLCERTEGWAAGLVLAGLSLRRANDPHRFVEAFGGDDQLVVDYLGDELFASLDAAERERLAVTSVVDRLCGPLVDHLTGTDGGTAWLAGLAVTNQLLLPLDATGTWYRHHQLVLDLLRADAAVLLGGRVPALHARAAEWFQAHGEPEAAVHHWIAAVEAPRAAQILGSGLGWWMIAGGEQATLARILRRLGDAARHQMGTALQLGWCALIANDLAGARTWWEQAREVRRQPDPEDDALFDSLDLFIVLAQGDVGGAVSLATRALASGRLADQFAPMATVTGAALAWAGRLSDARQALAVAEARARLDGAAANEVMAAMYGALVEAEVGSRSAARAAAERAVELATVHHLEHYPRSAVAFAVRAALAEDPARAQADAAHALALVARAANVLDEAYVVTVAADLALAAGEREGEELLERAGALVAACHDPGVVGSRLARLRSRHHVAGPAPHRPELVEQLSDRELAVLRYLPSRLSQREIAAELYVSLNTVKTHCRAIFRKLAVADRAQAVQRAREVELL